MNNQFVTFVIPSIDRHTIERTIDSLYQQTDNRWKALIIYDGVTPRKDYGSDKILTSVCTKKGSSGKNHGKAGLVRNVALKKIDTEWTAFLDDDDTITPDYVNLLLSKYADFDLVIFRMFCSKTKTTIPKLKDSSIRFGNVGISFAFKTPEQPIFFTKNRDGEDFDFIKKLIDMNYKHVVTDEVCYTVGA